MLTIDNFISILNLILGCLTIGYAWGHSNKSQN